jgi:ribosomal protein S18 acetylase RimI-like enzyme
MTDPGPKELSQIDNTAIRLAITSDLPTLASVHVRTWQHAYRGQIPDEYLDSLSVEVRVERFRELLERADPPREQCLVGIDAGVLVGFVSTCPSRDPDAAPDVGEVGAIYVLPEYWSRGWGRRLMSEALKDLAAGGFARATLWVLDTNHRARHFYELAGWSPDGTTRIDRRATFTLRELRYERTLASSGV